MREIPTDDRCLTVVIAAYNEAEVLPALQPRIAAALDMAESEGLEATLLYVDDGSQDATWSVMNDLAVRDQRERERPRHPVQSAPVVGDAVVPVARRPRVELARGHERGKRRIDEAQLGDLQHRHRDEQQRDPP
jgi:glycosyltransferase involved in cell wall biosynthesis